MADGVELVLSACSVSQIADRIVVWIAVQMARFHPRWQWAEEGVSDESVYVVNLLASTLSAPLVKGHMKPAMAVGR